MPTEPLTQRQEIDNLLDSLSLDACRCSDTNPDGSVYHCNACVKAERIKAHLRSLEEDKRVSVELLKRMEWSASSFEYGACPMCGEEAKHDTDCELLVALSKLSHD